MCSLSVVVEAVDVSVVAVAALVVTTTKQMSTCRSAV